MAERRESNARYRLARVRAKRSERIEIVDLSTEPEAIARDLRAIGLRLQMAADDGNPTARDAAAVIEALQIGIRIGNQPVVPCPPSRSKPSTVVRHLARSAEQVLGTPIVRELEAARPGGAPVRSVAELRELSVNFVTQAIVQKQAAPAIAGTIIGAYLSIYDGPRAANLNRSTKSIARTIAKAILPLVESATGRGRKLKRDGAENIVDRGFRVIGEQKAIDAIGTRKRVAAFDKRRSDSAKRPKP